MNDQEEFENLTKQLTTLEKMAKQFMTKEAISRYGNLKAAHPETAVKAISFIAQAAHAGHIREPLNDKEFKEILIAIQENKPRFNFKK